MDKNSRDISRDIRNFSWNFKIFIKYFKISLRTLKGVPRKLGWKTFVCTNDQGFPYAIDSIT